MKKSLQRDTLAFQLGIRPGVLRRDMSNASLPEVVASMTQFRAYSNLSPVCDAGKAITPKGNPEVDALNFYMLNHAVALVRQKVHPLERLGKYLPLLDLYHDHLAMLSARMFFYLLLICTRESRHEKNTHEGSFWISMRNKFGLPIFNFHGSIKGCSSSGAADKLSTNPPQTMLGNYTKFLVEVFNKGYYSGGYGGVAWGKVAEVLDAFVWGTITAEMMMDTAFTLCHNNGPIFNKGMLFDSYSGEIYKILDVQRSGQVPFLIGNEETSCSTSPEIKPLWNACNSILGGAFEGYVDWFLVEELGALKSYPSQKEKQVSQHGYPSKFKAKLAAQDMKKQMEIAKQKQEELSMVEILPGVKIKKVEVRP